MSANTAREAINVALAAARATGKVQTAPRIEQPRIPAGESPIWSNYLHGDVFLDLYGEADESEGCTVHGVSLAGTDIDLTCMTDPAERKRMGWDVDRWSVAAKQAERQQACADAAQYD